jgi:hypothetical protein
MSWRSENEQLRHDIERYTKIANDLATKNEELRKACGSAIIALQNRPRNDPVWDRLAMAALSDIDTALHD